MADSPPKNESAFMSTLNGFSKVLALIAAFIYTPLFFNETIAFVKEFAIHQYSNQYYEWLVYAWWALCFGLIFFVVRMILQALIMVLAISTARRAL